MFFLLFFSIKVKFEVRSEKKNVWKSVSRPGHDWVVVQFFEGAPYSDRWQIGTKLQKFGNRCSFRRKIESRWVLFMKMPSLLHNAVKCCTITVYLKYSPNLWLYILEIWCIKKDLVEKYDHNEFSI